MLIVGLTGNYGMGKSTVLDMFRELGAVTIKADGIVDLLLHDADVLARIRELLGDGVFSAKGALDRKKVASVVFRDKSKRDALEAILHPLVFERVGEIIDRISRNDARDKMVVIEIPLMFEKCYNDRFQKTITVYTDEETALKRLEKTGISKDNAMSRLNAQMPIHEKVRRADYVVNNSGTLEETKAQVRAVYDSLGELVAGSSGE
jgi:dephospho-CoA kinase